MNFLQILLQVTGSTTDVVSMMPLDHLVGVSLLVVVIVVSVLLFSYRVIREILKKQKEKTNG